MNEIVKIEDGQIVIAQEIVTKIIEFNKLKKEMEYQEKILKEGLTEAMQEIGIKKFSINGLTATIKEMAIRKTLDTKRLKEECPEIYEIYSKPTDVKASITLTVAD